jgi:hypothetical protein
MEYIGYKKMWAILKQNPSTSGRLESDFFRFALSETQPEKAPSGGGL